jgi:hypothetical protein
METHTATTEGSEDGDTFRNVSTRLWNQKRHNHNLKACRNEDLKGITSEGQMGASYPTDTSLNQWPEYHRIKDLWLLRKTVTI